MIQPGDQHSASSPGEAAPDQKTGRAELPPPAPDPDWGALLQQTAEMGGDVARLLLLELQLSLSSLKRMLVLSVAMLPVLLLAWVSLSAVPAVLVYEYMGSPTLAVGCFVLIQVLTLFLLRMAVTRYSRTLGLPLTRKQLRQFRGGQRE